MRETNKKYQIRLSDLKPQDFVFHKIEHTAPVFVLISKGIINMKEAYALLSLQLLTDSGRKEFSVSSKDLEYYLKAEKNLIGKILQKFTHLGILPPRKTKTRIKDLKLNIPRIYELAQEGL